jgi:hypothetical protein
LTTAKPKREVTVNFQMLRVCSVFNAFELGFLFEKVLIPVGWIVELIVSWLHKADDAKLLNSSFGFTYHSSFKPQLGKSGFYL